MKKILGKTILEIDFWLMKALLVDDFKRFNLEDSNNFGTSLQELIVNHFTKKERAFLDKVIMFRKLIKNISSMYTSLEGSTEKSSSIINNVQHIFEEKNKLKKVISEILEVLTSSQENVVFKKYMIKFLEEYIEIIDRNTFSSPDIVLVSIHFNVGERRVYNLFGTILFCMLNNWNICDIKPNKEIEHEIAEKLTWNKIIFTAK